MSVVYEIEKKHGQVISRLKSTIHDVTTTKTRPQRYCNLRCLKLSDASLNIGSFAKFEV
jgi:hypothetical protein